MLEGARSDSWEVISQRLNSMVGDSVGELSDRLTDWSRQFNLGGLRQ